MSLDNFTWPSDLVWVVAVPIIFAAAVLFICEVLGRLGDRG